MIRKCIHFSGHVQGVGFRYTTCRIAHGYAVSGYVKNLPNGQVELVVEGEASTVDAFLQDLRSRLARYIRSADSRVEPTTGNFNGFDVRY